MPAVRYPTKEKAQVEVYGKNGEMIARIRDLSKTGACIQCEKENQALEKGELLSIKVVLKALRKEHRMNAEVVWTSGNKSGIQFLTSEKLIEKMLSRGM